MTNDPAAVAWLEAQFEKQFRPGGGQRLDMGHLGERGDERADRLGGWFTCPLCGDPRPPQGRAHQCDVGRVGEPPAVAAWRAMARRARALVRRR